MSEKGEEGIKGKRAVRSEQNLRHWPVALAFRVMVQCSLSGKHQHCVLLPIIAHRAHIPTRSNRHDHPFSCACSTTQTMPFTHPSVRLVSLCSIAPRTPVAQKCKAQHRFILHLSVKGFKVSRYNHFLDMWRLSQQVARVLLKPSYRSTHQSPRAAQGFAPQSVPGST